MDLNELKKYFINRDFFYYNNYLGVIKNIEYDNKVGCYVLYFHGGEKNVIPYFYMLECFINLLKNIRIKILRDRNIKRLVHFTPMDNLESILNNGFLSRRILNAFEMNYQYSDSYRLDGKLDFISTSISFPNYKMFYSKRMNDKNIDWVVLSIDSSILVDKIDTEFYRTNCASTDPLKCRFNPCSNEALEDMFYLSRRDPEIPPYFTTDPQAEVMVKDKVNTSYISCIDTPIFDSDVNYLANNFHINYNNDEYLFGPRKDYKRW